MKIVEDDGEVIEELPDDSALIILYPDKMTGAVMPKMAGDAQVPEHIQLGAALLMFMKEAQNIKEVMRYLPRKKNRDYKAN